MPALALRDRQNLAGLVPTVVVDALAALIDNWQPARGTITAKQWREDAERIDALAKGLQDVLNTSPLVRGGYLGNAWAINKRGQDITGDWGGLGGPVPAADELVARLDELRALCRNAAHVIDDPEKAGGEFSAATRGPGEPARLGRHVLATLEAHGVVVMASDSGTAAEVLRIVLPACDLIGDPLNVIRSYRKRLDVQAEDVVFPWVPMR